MAHARGASQHSSPALLTSACISPASSPSQYTGGSPRSSPGASPAPGCAAPRLPPAKAAAPRASGWLTPAAATCDWLASPSTLHTPPSPSLSNTSSTAAFSAAQFSGSCSSWAAAAGAAHCCAPGHTPAAAPPAAASAAPAALLPAGAFLPADPRGSGELVCTSRSTWLSRASNSSSASCCGGGWAAVEAMWVLGRVLGVCVRTDNG